MMYGQSPMSKGLSPSPSGQSNPNRPVPQGTNTGFRPAQNGTYGRSLGSGFSRALFSKCALIRLRVLLELYFQIFVALSQLLLRLPSYDQRH